MQEDAINITGFFIEGFSTVPELELAIFFTFLTIYIIIIGGNLTIIGVISANPYLLTPMYIFLINLSMMDIASTSTVVPKLMVALVTNQHEISFVGCITQLYFFLSLACSEIILLTVMAYDRYVAICHPLHYLILMNLRRCTALSVVSWVTGFLDITGHAVIISKLPFCPSRVISHFFCDLTALSKLSCGDTSSVDLLNYTEGPILVFVAFVFTLISYAFIISTIVNIKSSEGRRKAFSTCSAHLTCVCVFYGTLIAIYMRPSSNYSPEQDKFVALLYVVLVPLVNPVIYSLKNEDVKKALRRKITKI